MTDNATQITERLASSETGMQPWLWLPLMRLLAQGDPVDIDDLAATTGRPVDEVRSVLAAMPDTEHDGWGRVIGQGLTQRATPHHFEIGGEALHLVRPVHPHREAFAVGSSMAEKMLAETTADRSSDDPSHGRC